MGWLKSLFKKKKKSYAVLQYWADGRHKSRLAFVKWFETVEQAKAYAGKMAAKHYVTKCEVYHANEKTGKFYDLLDVYEGNYERWFESMCERTEEYMHVDG